MRRGSQLVLLAVAAGAALLVAAAGGAGTAKVPRPTFAASSQSGPDRTFTLRAPGFRFTTAGLGKRAAPNAGHVHFSLDGGRLDRPPYTTVTGPLAREAARARGRYTPSAKATITYRGLPTGRHTLVAQLVNNLERRIGPAARTTFTVAPSGPPAIEFAPLPACPCGLPLVTPTYTFVLKIRNFTLTADGLGQRAAQGQGHVRFTMDGGRLDVPTHTSSNYTRAPAALAAAATRASGSYSPSVTASFTYANMPSGHHVLRAELFDNMGSALGVTDEIEFDIQ